MIEVFKTNVMRSEQARMLIEHIQEKFAGYTANFDLEDCDHILRVKSVRGAVEPAAVIKLMNELGCLAEVLPDEEPLTGFISFLDKKEDTNSPHVSMICMGKFL
jgi:hypothetical protein